MVLPESCFLVTFPTEKDKKSELGLFKVGGWDSIDEMAHQYYDCEFTQRMPGVARKGDKVTDITRDHVNHFVEIVKDGKIYNAKMGYVFYDLSVKDDPDAETDTDA